MSNSDNNHNLTENPHEIASHNPYSLKPGDITGYLETVVESITPYIDSRTNPDIGDFAVYRVSGVDDIANAARALEGQVFLRDWGLPPEQTMADFAPFEHNSFFFLLVDQNPDLSAPRLAGVMRVADCQAGPSETVGFFRESFGDSTPLPQELQPETPDAPLWDVVGIAADPDYRDGEKSAWLYHALYRNSLEQGVNKWISNVTEREMRNLRKFIGIPFKDVPNVPGVAFTSPITQKEVLFCFYYINVSEIFDEVSKNVIEREETGRDIEMLIARISRIALLGETAS